MKPLTKTLRLYSPHAVQRQIHDSRARFIVAACGRQMGKSTSALNHAMRFIWTNPGTTVWFVSPTYDQARVQYRRLVGMLMACPEILLKKNQTELRVKLINQSQLVFKSGDNYDALVGDTLDGCVIDEMKLQDPKLWPMVIRPMLAVRRGWCIFISTPNGFDAFYDMAQAAKADTTGNWQFIKAPSTANPLFTQEEFEAARRDMSDAQFRQEILAEFVNLTAGNAYKNLHDGNLSSVNPLAPAGKRLNPFLPIVVGCDFNVDPMAWVLGQVNGNRSHWFDEIWVRGTNTDECAPELVNRILPLIASGELKASPHVMICGDATNKSMRTSSCGKSDYDLLCAALNAAGITWVNVTPESNPGVKDRVNTVNARLKAADGSVSITLDPKGCPMVLKDLQRVTWKPNTTILDQTTDPLLTHSSDALGYPICELTPIRSIEDVGQLRVIRR